MDVRIQNVSANVSALGGDALVSPAVLERIVAAVLAALEERELRNSRTQRDVSLAQCCGGDKDREP